LGPIGNLFWIFAFEGATALKSQRFQKILDKTGLGEDKMAFIQRLCGSALDEIIVSFWVN